MKNKFIKYFGFILSSAVLIVIDQFTKKLALDNLYNIKTIVLIDNVLELTYVENRGAAFGILQNRQIFFYILTVIVLIVIFTYLYKMKFNKHYAPLYLSLILIFSGAVGNFIDRVKNKYVVDFIYFKLIDFPVFNFADICITIGCAVLILSLIFIYRGEDI